MHADTPRSMNDATESQNQKTKNEKCDKKKTLKKMLKKLNKRVKKTEYSLCNKMKITH